MSLVSALRKAGYIIDRVALVAEDGRQRSALKDNVLKRAPGDRFLSIQLGYLAKIIYRTIEHDVETILGDSIVGISEGAERVEVTFERGSPRAFDLVIGADGLHSAVRNALFGLHEKLERYLGYYAASFLTSGYPGRDERAYLSYAAPGRQINRYALRDDRTAFFFVFEHQNRINLAPRSGCAEAHFAARIFARAVGSVARDRATAGCDESLLRRS